MGEHYMMEESFKLRPHQIKAVKESPNKWGLWFKMRVGKSPTAIRLACSRAETALIISPKSVVEHWKNEIVKWKIGHCQVSVMSRETFKRDWEKLPGFEAIIVDECHAHFGNFKNQAYKALYAYIKRWSPRFVWLLTGTPLPASSWAIYSYMHLLGCGWNWYKWSKEFFYQVKMGNRLIPQPRKDKDVELQKMLRSIGTVIDLKDVADVPDDEDVIETFSLNSVQCKLIKDSFDPLPIVRFTRQHQLEQGVLKSDGYTERVSITCDKDKRLVELINDNDKICIVCRYHDQLDKIEQMLLKLGRKVIKISGRSDKTASELAVEAETASNCVVLAQGDTCVGYSLKSFNLMVFASMSFSFVNFDQMKSRMKAMEKTEPCQYIYMLTEGDSVDRGVYDAVMRKQDFSIELYKKK